MLGFVLTIWVDKWNDVKVVFVQESRREVIASFIAFDQLGCNVLDGLPDVSISLVTENYLR